MNGNKRYDERTQFRIVDSPVYLAITSNRMSCWRTVCVPSLQPDWDESFYLLSGVLGSVSGVRYYFEMNLRSLQSNFHSCSSISWGTRPCMLSSWALSENRFLKIVRNFWSPISLQYSTILSSLSTVSLRVLFFSSSSFRLAFWNQPGLLSQDVQVRLPIEYCFDTVHIHLLC